MSKRFMRMTSRDRVFRSLSADADEAKSFPQKSGRGLGFVASLLLGVFCVGAEEER
jgi:hypothetical protein